MDLSFGEKPLKKAWRA